MKKLTEQSPLSTAAVLGFIVLVPFVALELINRWKFNEGFPWAVFIFTYILQTVFIFLFLPIVKTIQAGKSLTHNPVNILFRFLGMAIIAYIWSGWIMDQWPCLMGVPNCD